jgi:hypothetical protein
MGVADLFSNRNAIINGEFNIWQRGSSFSNIADAAFFADRWKYLKGSTAAHTVSRSTDVPAAAQAGRLFNYSALIDCTTLASSIGATERIGILQIIEGYNWLPLAQKEITLSFWVKATKAGTYCISLQNAASDRTIVKEYAINASNTWEYKTITFPASPSAGTWDYTTGAGLQIIWTLAAGTNFQGTPGIWSTSNLISTSSQVNGADSTANDFRLCGFQLEAGSVATPFEHRSFQQELKLCERYYQFVHSGASFVATIHSTAGTVSVRANFRQQMRAAPSVGQTGIINAQYGTGFNNTQSSPSITAAYTGPDSCYVTLGNFNTSGQTNSIACSCPTPENNSNVLTLNAEI